MSKTGTPTTELSPKSSVIIKIIASHSRALEALATTSAYSLHPSMLLTSYVNEVNLACPLYCSDNLTDRFSVLVTDAEDIMHEHNIAITNHNTLTTQQT
jgi:hypothetical protein